MDWFKQGLKLIRNWEEVASVTIQRLHHEKMVNPGWHIALLEKLLPFPIHLKIGGRSTGKNQRITPAASSTSAVWTGNLSCAHLQVVRAS